MRIEAAKKLLEENNLTVNEVMYEAGYSDNKAFRYNFKKVSGVSPLVYRQNLSDMVLFRAIAFLPKLFYPGYFLSNLNNFQGHCI